MKCKYFFLNWCSNKLNSRHNLVAFAHSVLKSWCICKFCSYCLWFAYIPVIDGFIKRVSHYAVLKPPLGSLMFAYSVLTSCCICKFGSYCFWFEYIPVIDGFIKRVSHYAVLKPPLGSLNVYHSPLFWNHHSASTFSFFLLMMVRWTTSHNVASSRACGSRKHGM